MWLGKLDKIKTWADLNSLWYMDVSVACCKIEVQQSKGPRYDIQRYGMEEVRDIEKTDLMIIAGPITFKLLPYIEDIYNKMPDPKYVIALGSCSISGSPFAEHAPHSVIEGIDKYIPVDVYVPGCPPRPEAIFHGILELRKKIQNLESSKT